jgi:hypothetical protein
MLRKERKKYSREKPCHSVFTHLSSEAEQPDPSEASG